MLLYKTEEELIMGIKQGDNLALSILYKESYAVVSHFIFNNNGSIDDAKDVYQEAIIIFYEKVIGENFEINCKIGTYLYSVCRRIWLRKLAGKSNYTGKIDDFEGFLPIEESENEYKEENFEAMSTSLNKLGEPCKTLIEDFYIHNLNMNTISEKFGYTNADNAKNQKYKCLMRLKKLFFSTNIKDESL